ncbi:MAG: hypothetical protein AAGC44_11015 [Planctomycetota bacterium]
MKLTPKQKILIGVLGVGACALAVDRLVLVPPNEATAASVPAPGDAVITPPKPESAPAASPNPTDATRDGGALPNYAGLIHRLQEMQTDRDDESQDFFAEPPDWVPEVVRVEPEAGPRPLIEDAAHFLRVYRLDSVEIVRGEGTQKTTVAVINGKAYEQGDTLETFVLRGFTDNPTDGRAAVWESARTGQMFVMRVAR